VSLRYGAVPRGAIRYMVPSLAPLALPAVDCEQVAVPGHAGPVLAPGTASDDRSRGAAATTVLVPVPLGSSESALVVSQACTCDSPSSRSGAGSATSPCHHSMNVPFRLDLAEAVLGRSADYSAGHEQIAVAVDGHLVRYI
jgi:hypothetical protein